MPERRQADSGGSTAHGVSDNVEAVNIAEIARENTRSTYIYSGFMLHLKYDNYQLTKHDITNQISFSQLKLVVTSVDAV
jgi:hypothetical protein